jgi:hypothetical protein
MAIVNAEDLRLASMFMVENTGAPHAVPALALLRDRSEHFGSVVFVEAVIQPVISHAPTIAVKHHEAACRSL